MNLPQSVFNHMRSMLSFHELHASRSVCKRWNDITDVPKKLDSDNFVFNGLEVPPDTADFHRIKELYITAEMMDIIPNVFQQSSASITKLAFDSFDGDIDFAFSNLPSFPNVTSLFLYVNNNIVLSACPNLEELSLHDMRDFQLDFEHLSSLKVLNVNFITFGNISNQEKCQIEDISFGVCKADDFTLSSLYDCRHILENMDTVRGWWEAKPNLLIELRYPVDFIQLRFGKFQVHMRKNLVVINEFEMTADRMSKLTENAGRLREFLVDLKRFQSFKLNINTKIDEENKQRLMALLAGSMFFSMNELHEIVASAQA